MADRITLAEVLRAYDADVEMRLLGPLAVRYILQKRAALERLELGNAAREACGAGAAAPVAWIENDTTAPVLDELDGSFVTGQLVIVGRDWRPGVV